jgi:alpha-tubulin suppressor-like RCC1 family protein
MFRAWIPLLALIAASCADFSLTGLGSSGECNPNTAENCTRVLHVYGPISDTLADSSSAQLEAGEELVGYCNDLFSGPGTCRFQVSVAVSWSSSDERVATIDALGEMHTRAPGLVSITATDRVNNVSVTIACLVIRVTALTIAPETLSLVIGDTSYVAATATDVAGTSAGVFGVSWRSSNPQVATVDSATLTPARDGVALIRTVSLGTATVTATGAHGVVGSVTVTVVAAGALTFKSISAGTYFDYTCGVASGGRAYCWGAYANGNLGNAKISSDTTLPVQVGGTGSYATVDAGNRTTCALTPAGAAWCWGMNGEALVGDGTADDRYVPVSVAGGGTYRSLSVGGDHVCAIRTDGGTVCWGEDDAGELAFGARTSCPGDTGTPVPCEMSPVPVSGGPHFTTISSGQAHTCGITETGATECWGSNGSGQLGSPSGACTTTYYGTIPCSAVPLTVTGAVRFTAIAAGGDRTCALTSAGEAYCWGDNRGGQLGVRDTAAVISVPEAVVGGLTFASISVGGQRICALTTHGDAYCWGNPGSGAAPTPLAGGFSFRAISAGWDRVCALTALGVAYCWSAVDSPPAPVRDPQ